MLNAFGTRVYSLREILGDSEARNAIRDMLSSVLVYAGSGEDSYKLADACLGKLEESRDLADYEKEAHRILESEGIAGLLPGKFRERSRILYEEVSPYLDGGSVLDLGCGDGEIGRLVAGEGRRVCLADIYTHPDIPSKGLDFRRFDALQEVPYNDSEFGNTIALTVLHHSDYPIKTLGDAHRVTIPGGKFIAMESVYGVDGSRLRSGAERSKAGRFLFLAPEQQLKVNQFFDHFYNRVIDYTDDPKGKVNVPFNFNTPDVWDMILRNHGFEVEGQVHFGLDLPIVPEYHTLHVARVKK